MVLKYNSKLNLVVLTTAALIFHYSSPPSQSFLLLLHSNSHFPIQMQIGEKNLIL